MIQLILDPRRHSSITQMSGSPPERNRVKQSPFQTSGTIISRVLFLSSTLTEYSVSYEIVPCEKLSELNHGNLRVS